MKIFIENEKSSSFHFSENKWMERASGIALLPSTSEVLDFLLCDNLTDTFYKSLHSMRSCGYSTLLYLCMYLKTTFLKLGTNIFLLFSYHLKRNSQKRRSKKTRDYK